MRPRGVGCTCSGVIAGPRVGLRCARHTARSMLLAGVTLDQVDHGLPAVMHACHVLAELVCITSWLQGTACVRSLSLLGMPWA